MGHILRSAKRLAMGARASVLYRGFGAEWDERPRLFLLNTSSYRNIGDHAITLAERTFLGRYFPDHRIVEVTSEEWRRRATSSVKRYIEPDDVLFIHGGGYFGTQWGGGEEETALEMMCMFSENRIIVFPQTVFFSDSAAGEQCRSRRVGQYRHFERLTLFVRERASLEVARAMDCFRSGVYLAPDIVLSLNYSHLKEDRRGITLCFRKDEEMAAEDLLESVSGKLEAKDASVSVTDTVATERFDFEKRFVMVEDKIRQFAGSELVVTDRLHGMILCAISGTPCMALNNSNGKVFGVYEWIRALPYIRLHDNDDKLIGDILGFRDEVLGKAFTYPGLDREYEKMRDIIKSTLADRNQN